MRIKPFLLRIGQKIFGMGDEPGNAQTIKLVNNLVMAANVVVASEGLAIGAKAGLDTNTMLGIATHEFPNLFMITGPLSNMAVSIEQHVDWVADCIKYMRNKDIVAIEPELSDENDWVDHVQDVVSKTLYLKANSFGANVPGKPRVFIPYLGGAGVYRAKSDEVAAHGYRGFELWQRR